ncbi:MAG TPA: amino acid permease, partial [Brevundimonas diminuta]|nr:amino acid permease [Brevundimonas diminuta]
MGGWNVRKRITVNAQERSLTRSLSWPHLMAMGVGAIVGTGILTLIGIGADKAGPAVLLSFLIAGFVCACAALAYAEMASTIPASGSAYTYNYVVLGEVVAWIIGWSLILEYSLVVSAVAVSWSGYAAPLLHDWLGLPMALMQGPHAGGVANVPALFIILIIAGMLILGARKSATLNLALVVVKLSALVLFVWFALPHFNAANLEPFNPYGFGRTMGEDGVERGIMAAAAIIFSAFYGFDA